MLHSIHITDFRQFKNCNINFGKNITCIAGFNGTGKTTIMGLAGNSMMLSSKKMKTITNKHFKIEFRDLFKGSKKFDTTKSNICNVNFSDNSNPNIIIDKRISRITWQEHGQRFRVIPEWQYKDEKTGKMKKKSSKYPIPTFYLGLSRLYPIGETADSELRTKEFVMTNDDKEWFINAYKDILSIDEIPSSFESINIPKASNKSSLGISTEKYDYLTNSAGQDNLSQILLSVLSFEKCSVCLGNDWKGGVLFIDELDTTLHPIAQLKLCDFLYTEAEKFNFQIVFTTHSFTLLQNIAKKTNYNSSDQINKYQLIYLTSANGKLDIIENPPLSLIQSDLFMEPVSKRKIDIICEDRANRAFLKSLLSEYLDYVQIDEDIDRGCEELKHFYDFKPSYFSSIIFVLDGDARTNEKLVKFIENDNVLVLPTNNPPDRLIYEYLCTTNRKENFNLENGFTKRYVNEKGPETYKNKDHERQKYSSWFYDNYSFISQQECFKHWCEDNNTETESFIESFMKSYNHIAKRIGGRTIKR